MDFKYINSLKVFSPRSQSELIRFSYKRKGLLIAINAEKILHVTNQTRELINRNIGYPDGVGAVWALKKAGDKKAIKIPGVELWLQIINEFWQTKSFYLVGGKRSVIEQTINNLKNQFEAINILNYRDGYILSDDEKNELIADIVLKKPDIVFVAMGSPRQELLMEEMYNAHPALYQGLGGSFDVYTGAVERAPKWWVDNGLEWAYRLIKQPSRIKRQIHLLRFYFLLKTNQL